ncbi:MAG: SRPBCC domain-containing protein [Schleiferiaceae bacterium]|nr:SRPBCC domain-containing protein [Schleiferiaceae bacterium]
MADKEKFELEIPVKASPKMLFSFLSTPSGLADWFCDDVNSRGEIFTFFWEDSEESAKLIAKKTDKFIRFRWMTDEEAGDKQYYFEFKIEVDDLTNDVSLIVIDFAEPDEVEESKQLWDSQVHQLLHTIGA